MPERSVVLLGYGHWRRNRALEAWKDVFVEPLALPEGPAPSTSRSSTWRPGERRGESERRRAGGSSGLGGS
jgi:hypothetical protein